MMFFIYLVVYAFTSSITVYPDSLIVKKSFRTVKVQWNEIGRISVLKYRKNKYNVYLIPTTLRENSDFKRNIKVNWEYYNYEELVSKILDNCRNNKNVNIDKEIYEVINFNK
ncbi:hypothetical protein SDC9_195381 [bioreactor metagenome]|uniref:Uncharacterized protein n=1 Tax=bioreactor metagenome TaxID=1076179 RepID=A0A645I8U4_9ZZZZ